MAVSEQTIRDERRRGQGSGRGRQGKMQGQQIKEGCKTRVNGDKCKEEQGIKMKTGIKETEGVQEKVRNQKTELTEFRGNNCHEETFAHVSMYMHHCMQLARRLGSKLM